MEIPFQNMSGYTPVPDKELAALENDLSTALDFVREMAALECLGCLIGFEGAPGCRCLSCRAKEWLHTSRRTS